jgi:hypothetical protein
MARNHGKKVVDGRHKAGHDDRESEIQVADERAVIG